METSSKNFKQNFFNRAKSIFHHLRWFFCLSTQENDRGDSENNTSDQKLNTANSCLEILPLKNSLSFTDLPIECKLKIFSNLSTLQKGLCRQVCVEWKEIFGALCLWREIDLTSIKYFCSCEQASNALSRCNSSSIEQRQQGSHQHQQQLQQQQQRCSSRIICQKCYDVYRIKLKKFINFISGLQPYVQFLKFSFDLIDCTDDWLDLLQKFLHSVVITELSKADINWTTNSFDSYPSPINSQSLPCINPLIIDQNNNNNHDNDNNAFGGQMQENQNDLILRQRRRHRKFEIFFETFTSFCYSLKCLILPFEWTDKSLKMLCKLRRLESLTLLKCTNSVTVLETGHLNTIFENLPHLKHLKVEGSFGELGGSDFWDPASNSLISLDFEGCPGLFLGKIDLPALKSIKIPEKSIRFSGLKMQQRDDEDEDGNNNDGDRGGQNDSLTCLYDILKSGAPNLKSINDLELGKKWRSESYPELGAKIGRCCACDRHQ